MQLQDFEDAAAFVREHRELNSRLRSVKSEGLSISFSGCYVDQEMIAAVRPAIIAELQRRIDHVEADLTRLGVSIG